ncbi:MAG: peroxiredoxin family protein [Chloroflexi bacterium]|nr:peroxiredoxin family protein [Chloroflexota bacterium]
MSIDEPAAPIIRGPRSGRFARAFTLPAADGHTVRLWDFRLRKNLAIFFLHGAGCPRCRAELSRLKRHHPGYVDRHCEVLVVTPDPPEVSARLAAELGLPFRVLSDSTGATVRQQGLSVPAAMISDHREEVWAAWDPPDDLGLPTQRSLLGWLEFVAISRGGASGGVDWQPE